MGWGNIRPLVPQCITVIKIYGIHNEKGYDIISVSYRPRIYTGRQLHQPTVCEDLERRIVISSPETVP